MQYGGLARQVGCWRRRSRYSWLYRDNIVGLAGGKIILQDIRLYCNRQLALARSYIAIQQILLQGCVVG